MSVVLILLCFFFQAEDGIRDLVRSRGLGDVYKRQGQLDALNDQDFEDIAAYYASQKATLGTAKEELVELSLIHI